MAIDDHAFDEADLSDIIMQYDHSGRVLARMSNNTLMAEDDSSGFFVAADLSKSAPQRRCTRKLKKAWSENELGVHSQRRIVQRRNKNQNNPKGQEKWFMSVGGIHAGKMMVLK